MAAHHVRNVAAFLVLATALGCSGAGLAPVKGKVTLDGKPLAKGTITFESKGNRPATGTIVNGEILDVTTFRKGDGAPVGSHKVAINATEDPQSAVVGNPGEGKVKGNYMVGKSLIPSMYNDPNTSGLVAEIKSGDNTLEFNLSSQPAKAGK